ncbi:hypothetical protein U1Q18_050498 [Sarracenia purpurea var. burkii]
MVEGCSLGVRWWWCSCQKWRRGGGGELTGGPHVVFGGGGGLRRRQQVSATAFKLFRTGEVGEGWKKEYGWIKVCAWETVAYAATLDGNTAVVFVKGLNLRPDRESNSNQFSCHFGLGNDEQVAKISNSNSDSDSKEQKKKKKSKEKKYELCACTMVWIQASSLREWMMYHSWLGIERWFIYDNNSDDGIKEVVYLGPIIALLGVERERGKRKPTTVGKWLDRIVVKLPSLEEENPNFVMSSPPAACNNYQQIQLQMLMTDSEAEASMTNSSSPAVVYHQSETGLSDWSALDQIVASHLCGQSCDTSKQLPCLNNLPNMGFCSSFNRLSQWRQS